MSGLWTFKGIPNVHDVPYMKFDLLCPALYRIPDHIPSVCGIRYTNNKNNAMEFSI